MLTCSMMIFLSFLLQGMCACVVYVVVCSSMVYEVVLEPYVGVVVAVTVFVLHGCMLRDGEGARMTEMLVWRDGGCVVVVSAGHVGGTRGSCIVSSATDVVVMSVLRG